MQPNDMTDAQTEALIERGVFPTPLNAETILGNRPEINLAARMYDLGVVYDTSAPANEAWSCVDMNTYDGAPDSEAPATFIGRGPSAKAARMALLELFAEFDEAQS